MLKQASPLQLQEILASLKPKEADRLSRDWWLIARDNQLPPLGSWLYWLLLAGRGFGKTRTGAEWVNIVALANPHTIGHIVAATAGDIDKVMLNGPSGIITVASDDFKPQYIGSKNKLIWPNGTTAYTFSAEEPERLRGPQCNWFWADELAAWKRLQLTWDQLQFGYRLKPTLGGTITTTPRPLGVVKALVARSGLDVIVTRGSTFDNKDNLSEKFLQEVVDRYEGTRIGRQELNAEILDDVPGALWTREMIDDANLYRDFPDMQQVVIAVDPSGARDVNDEGADKIGIVAAGKGVDGRCYILADLTLKASPAQWGAVVAAAYDTYKADRVVAEKNFGGAMVKHVIQTADPNIPYKEVTASRGKVARAEPVAALYEQKRVTHASGLTELEDQLCQMSSDGWMGQGSPDNADAAIWAVTDLMLGYTQNLTFHEPFVDSTPRAFP